MLEVKELTAGYGSTVALHEVSLTVADREIVSLIGRNGAGKSTVLRAVAGHITPYGGAVQFNGSDITGTAIALKIRHGMLFIPQGNYVFPHLTVHENLEIGRSRLLGYRQFQRVYEEIYEKFPFIRRKVINRPASSLPRNGDFLLEPHLCDFTPAGAVR